MADVQCENGYTKIANELLEQLAKYPLNGTQWRIVLVIIRFTYGYKKKEAELSERFISEKTNIHKNQISRELLKLIDMNILIEIKKPYFNVTRIIKFNKSYLNWLQSTNMFTLNKNVVTTVNELVDPTVNELVDPLLVYKENYKENNKEKSVFFDNEELNILFLDFLQLRKKLKAVNSDRAIKMLITELNKYADDVKIAMIEKSIKSSWKDVYPLNGKTEPTKNNRIQKSKDGAGYDLEKSLQYSRDILDKEYENETS